MAMQQHTSKGPLDVKVIDRNSSSFRLIHGPIWLAFCANSNRSLSFPFVR